MRILSWCSLVAVLLAGCLTPTATELRPSTSPPPSSPSPYYYVDDLDRDDLHEYHQQNAILWGVLDIVTACMIPEGCGPRQRLWSRELSRALPLDGYVPGALDDKLVSVHGSFRAMSQEELDSTDHTEPRHWASTIFDVKQVKARGSMHVNEGGTRMNSYVEEWYQCQFPRNQTERIDYWGDEHHFAVRWEYYDVTTLEVDPTRFVTFWFRATDGEITHVQARGLEAGTFACWEPPSSKSPSATS